MADDYSDFTEDAGNQGRGNINPPMASEPQPFRIRRKGTAPRDGYFIAKGDGPTPADFGNAAIKGVENTGVIPFALSAAHGASMNLDDPIVSGVKSVLTGRPYKEIRKEQAEMRASLERDNPISSTAGNIAGSLYTGLRALPAASAAIAPTLVGRMAGVPATMIEQGVQGGVSTYAGSPEATLKDAATVGGLSSALAGTIGVAGQGVKALGAMVDKASVVKSITKLKGLIEDTGQSATASLKRLFPDIHPEAVRDYATRIVLMSEEALANRLPASVVAAPMKEAGNLQPKILNETQLLDSPFMSIGKGVGNSLMNNPFGVGGAVYGGMSDPGSAWDKIKTGAQYGLAGAITDRVPGVLARSAGTTVPEVIQGALQSKVGPTVIGGTIRNTAPVPVQAPPTAADDYSGFTEVK